jgi:hypothetical protein
MPYALILLLSLSPLSCSARTGAKGAADSTSGAVERLVIEITSADAQAAGGILAAIEAANAAGVPTHIISKLDPGTEVEITTALPSLRAADSIFDANGLRLRGGACTRADGRKGCDGFLVGGPNIRINDLQARNFTFDGIAVRGRAAVGVHISDCHCFDNLDDGVGVSAFATAVVVERCILEGNGFRTKGKGILVFDYAEAVLRENLVRGNRDGVTISRRATASLVGNKIIGNYDKGFGVAGAAANGRDNVISENGLGMEGRDRPPNGDGVRITLDSRVSLTDSVITNNGDSGVVVINTARFLMTRGRIEGNGGTGLQAADQALVELHQVPVSANGRAQVAMSDEGRVRQFR